MVGHHQRRLNLHNFNISSYISNNAFAVRFGIHQRRQRQCRFRYGWNIDDVRIEPVGGALETAKGIGHPTLLDLLFWEVKIWSTDCSTWMRTSLQARCFEWQILDAQTGVPVPWIRAINHDLR